MELWHGATTVETSIEIPLETVWQKELNTVLSWAWILVLRDRQRLTLKQNRLSWKSVAGCEVSGQCWTVVNVDTRAGHPSYEQCLLVRFHHCWAVKVGGSSLHDCFSEHFGKQIGFKGLWETWTWLHYRCLALISLSSSLVKTMDFSPLCPNRFVYNWLIPSHLWIPWSYL